MLLNVGRYRKMDVILEVHAALCESIDLCVCVHTTLPAQETVSCMSEVT